MFSIPPLSEADWIQEEYSYFEERFDPKPFNKDHKKRIIEILEETKSSIQEKSGNFVEISGNPGVYSNGKEVKLNAIEYIQAKILSCNSGFVVDDQWNELMVFTEINNEFYLFSWETGV